MDIIQLKGVIQETFFYEISGFVETAEKECFPENFWNKEQIHSHLLSGNPIYCVKIDGTYCGYLISTESSLEAELLRIGVPTEQRKKGIGTNLMERFLLENSGKKMFLEVSEKNLEAKSLYKKLGFLPVSIRRRYYPDGSNAEIFSYEK